MVISQKLIVGQNRSDFNFIQLFLYPIYALVTQPVARDSPLQNYFSVFWGNPWVQKSRKFFCGILQKREKLLKT